MIEKAAVQLVAAPAILVTSSWYMQLPETHARIGISRGTPRGQRGYRMYRKLAPGPWFRSSSIQFPDPEYRST